MSGRIYFFLLYETGHILSWLFGNCFIFLHSSGASEMNGWPWMASYHCSALLQTHPPLIIGASVLYFPFIFMVKLIPVVKLLRSFGSCQVGRGLEGYMVSPVYKAHCSYWDHLDVCHLVHLCSCKDLEIIDRFFLFHT